LKLYEYEAKNILKQYVIPTPRGELATTSSQARQAAAKLKPPFAVKAQVLVAGRGKAGGILFASSPEEAKKAAESLLKTQIKGIPVRKVLIEEKIITKKELYFSITIDRANRRYVAIASTTGGVDVEETAANTPHGIMKTPVVPHEGFSAFNAEHIAEKIGYSSNQRAQLANILKKVYQACMDYDAELVEINPLAETTDGFTALDARLIIDDNALFRHPEYEKLLFEEEREHTSEEIEAMRNGLAYVKLDGDIGVVGNGAGLVMATLDVIQYYGGKPANFLDLGGGAPVERIAAALKIVLSDPNVKALFINILGGMTRCDDVARAITQAKRQAPTSKPIVIRLVGTNEEEGKRILTKAGMHVVDSMEEAAQQAVETARENL
jgi:succinyl-CoA synthetase beta subunit